MTKKTSILIVSLLISIACWANNPDSLIKILNNVNNNTEKVKITNRIAIAYIDKYPEKALDYAHKASIIAREIGYHHGLIESLIITGKIYKGSNNNKQAISYFEKASEGSKVLSDSSLNPIIRINLAELYFDEKLYNKANDYIELVDVVLIKKGADKTMFNSYLSINSKIKVKIGNYEEAIASLETLLASIPNNSVTSANIFIELGKINQQRAMYGKSQNYFYQALKIFEANKSFTGLAETYMNLANLNLEQNLYDNALDFNFRALSIYNEMGDLKNKSVVFDNIGSTYQHMSKFNRAVDYYSQSLIIRNNLNDPLLISTSYNNLAKVYEDQQDISKAIIYHFKSIKIREDIKDNEAIAEAYVSLARLYFHNLQYDKAIEIATKAYRITEKTGDTWLQKESAKLLAEANQKLGNFKEGYYFYEAYSVIKDSLYTQQRTEQISRLEAIYQNEKKQKEIALLNKEKQEQDFEMHQQDIQRNGLLTGIGLMIGLFIFIYRAYKQKTVAGRLLETQKAIIEKKNKDIVSSLNYAKRIQDSILPKKRRLNDLVSDSFVLFMPKEIVSGDFYWFDKVDDKSIFAVVDCTGHGVPGAFMSMIAGELLNDIIKIKKISDPGEILKTLHKRVVAGLNKNEHDSFTVDGMNIAICIIEEGASELKFSSSSRPLIHLHKNDVMEISGSKFPIGMITRTERKFETKTIQFEKDDLFYIFTDGITDQFNGKTNEKLTREGLINQLSQIKSNSLKVQYRLLKDFFNDWKKGTPQIDDVCMIGVRV